MQTSAMYVNLILTECYRYVSFLKKVGFTITFRQKNVTEYSERRIQIW